MNKGLKIAFVIANVMILILMVLNFFRDEEELKPEVNFQSVTKMIDTYINDTLDYKRYNQDRFGKHRIIPVNVNKDSLEFFIVIEDGDFLYYFNKGKDETYKRLKK